MTATKVGRAELRKLRVGQTEIYQLPTAKDCASTRVAATWLQQYEGMAFTTKTDAQNCIISITRTK
jgi:hypothetical protein